MLRVQCSLGVSRATITVTSTQVTLVSVLGAVTTTTNLTFAAYTTLAAMAAAIGAVSGWEAEISNSDYDEHPVTDLAPVSALACLDESVYLEVPDEELNDFIWYADDGVLVSSTVFPMGAQNMLVAYRGGYETVPNQVALAAAELASERFREGAHDRGLQSETLGDYKWVAKDPEKAKRIWDRLALYRDLSRSMA